MIEVLRLVEISLRAILAEKLEGVAWGQHAHCQALDPHKDLKRVEALHSAPLE